MTKIIKRGYVTEKQAAKILGKTQKSMQNDRYKGQKLPFIKHEGRILYKKSDLRAEWETTGSINILPDDPALQSQKQDDTIIRILTRRILIFEDRFARFEDKFEKLEARVKRTEIEKPKGWLANLIG